MSCGPLCLVYLGFSVLCLKESLMCWLMGRGVSRRVISDVAGYSFVLNVVDLEGI